MNANRLDHHHRRKHQARLGNNHLTTAMDHGVSRRLMRRPVNPVRQWASATQIGAPGTAQELILQLQGPAEECLPPEAEA